MSDYHMSKTIQSGELFQEAVMMFGTSFSSIFITSRMPGVLRNRDVLLSSLRGQAETFAYGLQLVNQRNYDHLKQKMEERFGHTTIKEKYIAEAKVRT